ncbi:MAG TPA: hypothetical protein VNT79_05695, partial [Phycisphaerae bacterium]|nr:hypothetical protein [Phycisphaerae bacterium]
DEVHEIVNGLPAGTTIQFAAIHTDFFCRADQPGGGGGNPCSFTPPNPPFDCDIPGGLLGGEQECNVSKLHANMQGTGGLSNFSKNVVIDLKMETHVGPRSPGDPIQSFDTDMFMLQGQLPPGDPDFDLLRITAGTAFGMPSPGHTTLTRLPGDNWAVDSFFDVFYRIDFVGKPGGPLGGMSGSTTGTIRMATGAGPAPECVGICPEGTICRRTVVSNTDGTVDICCECIAECVCPGDVFEDGVLNGKDLNAFVRCLLGPPPPSPLINCACVDFDGNGASQSDIPLFVEALLTKQPCPPDEP